MHVLHDMQMLHDVQRGAPTSCKWAHLGDAAAAHEQGLLTRSSEHARASFALARRLGTPRRKLCAPQWP